MSCGRAFLTKIEDRTTCVKLKNFHNNLVNITIYTIIYIILQYKQYIVGCYQNRNPSQTFLWRYTHLQKFQELFLVELLLNQKTEL